MKKAIFVDFYGTLVYENGPVSMEVVKQIYKNSDAKTPEEAVHYWWKRFGETMKVSSGAQYRLQYDIALESFQESLEYFHSDLDAKELCDKMAEHWCCPPIYEESKQFLEQSSVPIYIVTNSDNIFVETALKKYGLKTAGVITSERARCYKYNKNIYLYALSQAGLCPDEVIHIGDSLDGDVAIPKEAGIKAVWLNREGGSVPENVEAVGTLSEFLEKYQRCD